MWETVDGMNPRKGMERMVRWLKAPVDYNTPTFSAQEGKKEKERVSAKL
jgi:hypothetical protein